MLHFVLTLGIANKKRQVFGGNSVDFSTVQFMLLDGCGHTTCMSLHTCEISSYYCSLFHIE